MSIPKVVIIGGGISGLAIAYYLQKWQREHSKSFQITLLEASSRFGGLLETQQVQDSLVECGPDMFLSERPAIMELCEDLGLESELQPTQEANRRSFILQNKKLVPVPKGFYLMAPHSFKALMGLSQLSLGGKMRMALEPLIAGAANGEDESVSQFVTRRLGREALERLAQPMLAGIYMADPDQLSLKATMPQFSEMEKEWGSVMRGLKKRQRRRAELASGPRYQLFLSFKQGMEYLPKKLVESLKDVELISGSPVKKIEQVGAKDYRVQAKDIHEADYVCSALPAYASGKLVESFAPDLSANLSAIPYESAVVIIFTFRKSDIDHPCDGFGFVVPQSEGRSLVAGSFTSRKFAGRSPEDTISIRVFLGGAFHRALLDKSDLEIEKTALQELKEILGVKGDPVTRVFRRYAKSMPQYHVGHLARVDDIEAALEKYPGLYLAGNAYRGVGIPDSIAYAKSVAERMMRCMTTS